MDYREFLQEYGNDPVQERKILSNGKSKKIATNMINSETNLAEIAKITGIAPDWIVRMARGENLELTKTQICKLQSLSQLRAECSIRTEAFRQLINHYIVDGILGVPQIAEITGIAEDRIRRLKGGRQRKMKRWEIENLWEVMEKINQAQWQSTRMPVTEEIEQFIKAQMAANRIRSESERLTNLQLAQTLGIGPEVMIAVAYGRSKTIAHDDWKKLTELIKLNHNAPAVNAIIGGVGDDASD